MQLFTVILFTLLLTGCMSSPEKNTKSLLETLEFDEDETGCFRLTGVVDVNPIPLMSSNINVNLVKKKGDDSPDC